MSAPASTSCGSKSGRGVGDGVDRLSRLPDEVLHRVVSFLPMPEAVRTSLLSPTWRYLWAFTPYIRIDRQDFEDCGKLKNFGDRLLLLRDSTTSLDEARISAHNVIDTNNCCEWVRYAIMHKVRLLHVLGPVLLDSTAMFPSQYLKTVRLRFCFLRHGAFRPLNCDCRVLEHLELKNCGLWDLKEISSRSLKVLRIFRCIIIEGLVICATNLTHLSIVDPQCDSCAIVTRDLPSLVTTTISLRSDMFHYTEITILGHGLLDGLSHATTLELHAPLPELAFERGLRTCPVFNNLRSLVLADWCMAANFYPLRCLLHRLPKLQELSFKLEMEECRTCKESESALPSSRGAPPLGAGSYPCIKRIKVYCHKEDPRASSLVQALQPIVGDVKNEHRASLICVNQDLVFFWGPATFGQF